MSSTTILTSPAEPEQLRRLGATSPAVEHYGADFLIAGEHGIVGVQRKAFPSDFLASVTDGRLHTVAMSLPSTTYPVLVLEGAPRWTSDGELLDYRGQAFNRKTLNAMVWSLNARGIHVAWTESIAATAEFILQLAEWWGRDKHDGFSTRPGPGRTNDFGQAISARDWGSHMLQGFDGIGPELAGRIFDEFNGVPLRWTVTKERLGEVDGMGPKRLVTLGSTVEFIEQPRKRKAKDTKVLIHRRDAKQSSIDGAYFAYEWTGVLKKRIWDALMAVYPDGLTDEQLIAATGDRTSNSTRGPRGDLVKTGWLVSMGDKPEQKRRNISGILAMKHRVVLDHEYAEIEAQRKEQMEEQRRLEAL